MNEGIWRSPFPARWRGGCGSWRNCPPPFDARTDHAEVVRLDLSCQAHRIVVAHRRATGFDSFTGLTIRITSS
jgi:hypothetical protein